MANPKTTLFLGDLPALCTEHDIYSLYSSYGEIKEIKIMRSEENYRNLSYGFIKFADTISAEKALIATDGVLFGGRNLKVGWASYKNKKETTKTQSKDKMNSSSVHISYISYQLTNLITEESLRKLFSKYGTVLDCSIKKSYIDESINRQCGYGFVHFSSDKEGIDSALAAVAGLNDATLENVCYKCSISHNLEKQLLDLHRQNNTANPHSNVTSNCSSPMNQTPRSRVNSNNFNNNVNLFQQPAASQASFTSGNSRMQLQLPRSLSSTSDALFPSRDNLSKSADDNRFILESTFAARQQHIQQPPSTFYQPNVDQQSLSFSLSSYKSSHPSSKATSPTFFANNNANNINANRNISSVTPTNALQVSSSPSGLFDNHLSFSDSTPSSAIFGGLSGCASSSTGFDSHSTSTKSNHSLFSIQSASSLSSLDLKQDSVTPKNFHHHHSHSHHHHSHPNMATNSININKTSSGSFLDSVFHFPSHLSHSVGEHFPDKPVSSLLNFALGTRHNNGPQESVVGSNQNILNQSNNSPLFGDFPVASSSPSGTNTSSLLLSTFETKLHDQDQNIACLQEYSLFDSRSSNHFNNNSNNYTGLF